MKKIILFDPSLGNNKGAFSNNLGDVIINDAIMLFLKFNFKDFEIVRISTHTFITKKEKNLIKNAQLVFVGGTNLLSADIKAYNQWKSSYYKFIITMPIVNNAILFGVGWWQYQNRPTKYTSSFYRRLLAQNFIHSVRDSYTSIKIDEIGINNQLNTSCPTTWELNGIKTDRKRESVKNVLLMLSDYHPNTTIDNELITILLEKFTGKIYFFPQGKLDEEYLKSLSSYKTNVYRFALLRHVIDDLNEFVTSGVDFVYIGTRLHGGIKCLQNGISALILSNDNRSKEMGKDINLAVVARDDFSGIIDWIEYNTQFGQIFLPKDNIDKWKSQFLNHRG